MKNDYVLLSIKRRWQIIIRLFKFFKRLRKPKKSILTQVQKYFKEEYGVNVSVKVHIHTIHNNYTKEEAIEMGKWMAEKENMPVRRLDDVSFNVGTLLDREIIIFFGGE